MFENEPDRTCIGGMAYNFNCRIEIEGLVKVTGSHVHCKSSSVLEAVCRIIRYCIYRSPIGNDIMAYEIMPFPTTLSVLRGHSPLASLFKLDFYIPLCSN